jgi:hypothetical protein
MIAVSLRGGLGNQLFGYAAGRSLALEHGTGLVLDLSELERSATRREFALGDFRIDARIVRRVRSRGLHPDLRSLRGRLGRWRREAFSRFRVLHSKGFALEPGFFTAGDWTHLVGYWQSERYFEAHADRIREELSFRSPPGPHLKPMLERIGSTTSVSVHVRRGDYVTNPEASAYHGVLSTEYYGHAFHELSRNGSDLHAFVFSDDLGWCREHVRLDVPTTYVDAGRTAADDLRLMASCLHHVIANSSFSWWGAWLGERDESTVIAPLAWVRDPPLDTSHAVPERWLRL